MAYQAGVAFISVLPTLKGFQRSVEAQLRGVDLDVTAKVKPEVDKAAAAKAAAEVEAMSAKVAAARDKETESAGKVRVAEQRLQELRDKGNTKASALAAAEEKLATNQRALAAAQKATTDSSSALEAAQNRLLEAQKKATDAAASQADAARNGDRAAGAFADAFKARLESAIRTLPDIKIDAHSSEADIVIAEVRRRLETLSDKRIGIDIDETIAVAELDGLKAALDDVARQHPSVSVRADTAAASAKLDEVSAQLRGLDGKTAKVDVNVDDKGGADKASGGLSLLSGKLFAVVAGIPALAAAGPAIAGIGLAAVAAAAGAGVLAIALNGIGDAYSAMVDADTSASTNATKNAHQVQDAERSLAEARASAADGAVSAAERVASAQQSLSDAERTSAERVQDALLRQQQAEISLATAQRDALRAQQALTDARRDAQRGLEDMQIAAVQADIDQKNAVLSLAQAQQALASVQANPFAAPGQLLAAQLGLQQAQLEAKRATLAKSRSSDDFARAQTAGVEGSPQVVSAQDQLSNAQQGVSNAQQAQIQAARDVADAQIEAANRVASAQQAITDAYREQASQARQSSNAIISAEEALATAAQGDVGAVNKVNEAMAKLAPAGQQFVLFLHSIKPELDSIGAAVQTGFLPGLQAGMQALLPVLPAIRDLFGAIGSALGGLATQAGQILAGPWWQDFFRVVGQEIVPALQTMGTLLGNFIQGGAGIFRALIPVATAFGQALIPISEAFAHFAESPAMQKIVEALTSAAGPAARLIGLLGDALGYLLPPLLSVGAAMLNAIVPALEKLLPPLGRVVGAVGDALVKALVAAAPSILKMADALGHFIGVLVDAFAPVLSQVAGLIGDLGKALSDNLAAALPLMEPLLKPMADSLSAILGLVGPLVPMILQLAGQALTPLLQLLPVLAPMIETWAQSMKLLSPPLLDVVKTLLEALLPVIKDLAPVIRPLLESLVGLFNSTMRDIIVPLLLYVVIPAMKAIADILKWLVDDMVHPLMLAFGKYSQDAYDNYIKPAFHAMDQGASLIGQSFKDFVKVVKEAWDDLGKIVGTPVKFMIDTVFNGGIGVMINTVADLVHAPRIAPINTSGIPHFAGGGVLDGYAPGQDTQIALLSPGEGVLVPEAVRALGARNILALNAAMSGRPASTGGAIPQFAGGGVVGDVLSLTGDLGKATKWLTDPVSSLKDALGSSTWVDMLAHATTGPIEQAADFLWKQVLSLGGLLGGGSSGSPAGNAQLDQWIAAAMAFASVPASWSGPLHTLIMRESGGNPRAINLTDSNALAGHPSQGLMQTIPGTFATYRDQRLSSDITDPVANIVAGINYIKARYGSIFSVQQAVGATPQGYAGGGVVPPYLFDDGGQLPVGYSTVLNATRKPEAVFTSDQLQSFSTGFPSDGWEISGVLDIDGMDARIDGRIQNSNSDTGTAIARRSRL